MKGWFHQSRIKVACMHLWIHGRDRTSLGTRRCYLDGAADFYRRNVVLQMQKTAALNITTSSTCGVGSEAVPRRCGLLSICAPPAGGTIGGSCRQRRLECSQPAGQICKLILFFALTNTTRVSRGEAQMLQETSAMSSQNINYLIQSASKEH